LTQGRSRRGCCARSAAIARERIRDAYLTKTQQVIAMLTTSFELASVIGSMRWHLLEFADPAAAYSDHPVVVWAGRSAHRDRSPGPNSHRWPRSRSAHRSRRSTRC
jgi:hypothetical protein